MAVWFKLNGILKSKTEIVVIELKMENTFVNRREWLRQTAAAVAVTTTLSGAARSIAVRAFEPDGKPCAAERFNTLFLTDRNGQPFRMLAQAGADGMATIAAPKEEFEIMMILPVRDFGQVYLYADNGGVLYPPASPGRELLLNYEFARSRAAFVRRYVKAAQAEGVAFTAQVTQRLDRGEAALARAVDAKDIVARTGHSNDSLADTMWAGEMAAVQRARHHIGRNGPRPGFLFGCNAFGYAKSEEYARLYRDVFNYATLPFYRLGTEKVEGSPDYSAVDAILEKMSGTAILTKGHPLVWMHYYGIPEFLKRKSWEDVKRSCREYILRSVGRYRLRIHAWDVINEAHDWANELDFDEQQLLELTRLAADTARIADPTAFRVVNCCEPWGEYVARGKTYKCRACPSPVRKPERTPIEYLKVLEAAWVSYEAVGLQLYDPLRDMLEIERLVERFFAFGKPIHVTELGVLSSSAQATWHGEAWTGRIQADWVEQFYTICYSKPQVQAITWWDFADPAFIADGDDGPLGSFLDKDMRPKESYQRLKDLLSSWKG
jgi:endo-1,4-beta-xylanase